MYKKYDQSIKDTVIQTGDVNAFPELNIPRTTALYWIKKSKSKTTITNNTKSMEAQQSKSLEQIIRLERLKNGFLQDCSSTYRKKLSKTQENKEIIKLIKNYRKLLPVSLLCKLSGFNDKVYYQTITKCNRISYTQKSFNQLTVKEQATLINISKDTNLSHLSIKQLQLHAFRENLLHCHYDTWRKYINTYNPARQIRVKRKTKKKIQKLRYNQPCEAWHIDVTYFKGVNNSPLYAQFIMDSYSRAIISSKVSLKRNSTLTLSNLSEALIKQKPKILICDGGGENINLKTSLLLKENNIVKVLASGKDKFINSRIEAFFNTIKSRYINKYKIYSAEQLKIKIKEVTEKYNNSPLTIFHGATPNEIINSSIDFNFLKDELHRKREYAKIKRKNNFNQEVLNSRTTRSRNNQKTTKPGNSVYN